jgi:hypothetical protein
MKEAEGVFAVHRLFSLAFFRWKCSAVVLYSASYLLSEASPLNATEKIESTA